MPCREQNCLSSRTADQYRESSVDSALSRQGKGPDFSLTSVDWKDQGLRIERGGCTLVGVFTTAVLGQAVAVYVQRRGLTLQYF